MLPVWPHTLLDAGGHVRQRANELSRQIQVEGTGNLLGKIPAALKDGAGHENGLPIGRIRYLSVQSTDNPFIFSGVAGLPEAACIAHSPILASESSRKSTVTTSGDR